MNNSELKNKGNIYRGFAKMKFLVMFLCVAVCAVYLGIINTTAVKGYEVRKFEQKIDQLKKDNKQLQIEEAELNSFYNIKDNIEGLNMVPASDVVYIDSSNKAVAIRK
jgi:cell division protein FtsL